MRKILIFILALFSFSAIYSHTVVFDKYWRARACKTCGKILVDMWGVDSVVSFLVKNKSIGLLLNCDSLGHIDSVFRVRIPRTFDTKLMEELKEEFNDYFATHEVRCEFYLDCVGIWVDQYNPEQYIAELEDFLISEQSALISRKKNFFLGQLAFPGELSFPSGAIDDGYEELSEFERILIRLDIPLDSINLNGINVDSV